MANNDSSVSESFADRHRGNRFLDDDPLYALTLGLVDAIKTRIPEFFAMAEEAFERDLANTVSFGFFHQRPLGRVGANASSADSDFASRHRDIDQNIQAMLKDEYRRDGVENWEIDEASQLHEARRTVIRWQASRLFRLVGHKPQVSVRVADSALEVGAFDSGTKVFSSLSSLAF